MGKAAPFPPEISHNTDRPHNAFGPDLPVSYSFAGTAEYHVSPHHPQWYNARHWWLPDQSLSLHAYAEVPDLPPAAPEFRDPVIPERNFPCQKYPDNAGLQPSHPHTFPFADIWQPHRQGRHSVQ